ncbi:ABC transporter ATP-binding protein [Clostridium sardiniense]|uniref:ABC transporter ATP-binding protein n=1 Tax=Clostridium sardiniense TaxID=29369 RepID=A0ABS7KXQ9_CLOSR|nr:ABC transporter ATP-binding protein [Clostridium sardiniense]MBY0755608.1 ABC transporter ATP-binding protein [Clostridium sardiniense]MDQ0460997.1 iron complex transport system ATP-binding protein [Clostridium sardiniense]
MIKLDNVYTGYDKIDIIKNANLEVNKNELFCIIGPNGCGKSTLLKAIANINDYTGSIKILDKEIKSIKRKELAKEIALMSQITEVYFSYTVYETISLGRYAHIKGAFTTLGKDDKIIIDSVIEDLSLKDIENKYISELSGGQLQRVFLARAIVQNPKVILLDEPTNHLDFKHQIELLENLKKWCRKGERTVIGVLHDLNLVQIYADRVALINNGEIVNIGSSEEILKSKEVEDIYGINIREFMIRVLKKWS